MSVLKAKGRGWYYRANIALSVLRGLPILSDHMVCLTVASRKDSSIVGRLYCIPRECLSVARDLADYAGIENYISLLDPESGATWVWYGRDYHG